MNTTNISKTIYNHSYLLNEYLEQSFSEMEDLKEWSYFLNFIQDNPDFVPYRTEWTIFHEDLKLAGSIDMVYKNEDGTLNIYDWKRAKNITPVNYFNKFAVTEIISHFPDSNFWHYALQLNTYQAILEDKYNKKVKDLYLVRLHPDAEEENYELIKIPNLQKEIKELWAERKKTFIIKKT
jgi:ATP-dependent exoDNAse (exonuclease V) beta subunit